MSRSRARCRNLVILDINDDEAASFSSGQGHAKHFEVSRFTRWKHVQETLAGFGDDIRPDILLVDISFVKDGLARRATTTGSMRDDRDIVPVGQTLALPFLNARAVMGFAPYSAHMKNEELKTHPPFLIAMGLMAAKMEGTLFSSRHLALDADDSDGSLDKFLDSLETVGNPAKGIEVALPQYQQHLKRAIRSQRVTLLNGADVIATLQSMEAAITQEGLPSVEVPASLGLEIVSGFGDDNISLRSLFADCLNWVTDRVDAEALGRIVQWVEDAAGDEPAFTTALKVIREQDNRESATFSRPRADSVLMELYPALGPSERREVFRLCVLFANAHAWAINAGSHFDKIEVFKRLGPMKGKRPMVEQNTYLSWFGVRDGKRTSGDVVCGRTIKITPLSTFREWDPLDHIGCCFLGKDVILSENDDWLVRRYLTAMREAQGYPSWRRPYRVESE
jgi:hypothetical protein